MATRITAQDTHLWLKDSFRTRRDIGIPNWLANLALCPSHPFDAGKRPLPRLGFLFMASVIGLAVGAFFYFNLAR
jgi:hypothetical protein